MTILHRLAATLALIGLPVLATAATPTGARALEAYPVEEIAPGLEVEAHTVFAGTEVESFPLVVLGVLHRGRAMGDLILARATSPRVEHTGIVAGMSGSPVYAADGRILGALAFGWSFTKDPICGITPIAEMTELWDLDHSIPAWSFEPGDPLPPKSDGSSSAMPRLRTPVAVSGIDPEALAYVEPWLEERGFLLTPGGVSAVAAGASEATADGPPKPGDAVAVDLLRGDGRISAIGTLTAVDGERVLAFGHPFLYTGSSHLPLSRAEIIGIIPSTQSSFKLGVAGEPIGSIEQDRRTGVAGRLGAAPSMMPLEVRLRVPGADWESFHYEIVRHRYLAPALATVAAASGVISRGAVPPESAWRWKLRVRYRSGGVSRTLELTDFTSGIMRTPLFEAVGEPLGALLNNPWSAVEIDTVMVEMDLSDRLQTATVSAVRLDRSSVRPGEVLGIEVDLKPFRGPSETVTLSYPVPAHLAPGPLSLFVGGGGDLNQLDTKRQPGRYRPGSLADLVSQLETRPLTSRLYVTAYAGRRELTVRGQEYPELPGAAQMVLSPTTHRDATTSWSNTTRLDDVSHDYDRAVIGGTLLQVEVSNEAPTVGGDQ